MSDKDFSDDEMGDSFEESKGHGPGNGKKLMTYENKPYDAGVDLSQDLSMADSYDQQQELDKKNNRKSSGYDESLESQSSEKNEVFSPKPGLYNQQSMTTPIANKPFDEAMEFSQSDDDDSAPDRKQNKSKKALYAQQHQAGEKATPTSGSGGAGGPSMMTSLSTGQSPSKQQQSQSSFQPMNQKKKNTHADSKSLSGTVGEESGDMSQEEDDEDDDDDEDGASYENIEGAYNPAQYDNLNVATEIKDLFQYISRFKPHEVELMTTLKCFIPEFIPSIGEIDAFIKVPRPDGKADDLGLKYLDEPAANQSDPTVLELQLRAMTKKVQSSDVVVRSVEEASKNPSSVDRWIQSITDLHGSKPPPQVLYKHNYPDIDTLMQVWPEAFEEALEKISLPSPDLDISLPEYSKLLCSLLDIPTYENSPIEPLHLMFSLYIDFKNNPHFMNEDAAAAAAESENMTNMNGNNNNVYSGYGGADVMEIEQGYEANNNNSGRRK